MRSDNGTTPLHEAAEHGHLEIVKYLVEECTIVRFTCANGRGDSPVHSAALSGHLEVVQYFIRNMQMPP